MCSRHSRPLVTQTLAQAALRLLPALSCVIRRALPAPHRLGRPAAFVTFGADEASCCRAAAVNDKATRMWHFA